MSLDAKIKFINHLINSPALKSTRQRKLILEAFLNHGRSMNVDELFAKLRKENSTIGYSTVYRTLKLFAASGVAREIRMDNSAARYVIIADHN